MMSWKAKNVKLFPSPNGAEENLSPGRDPPFLLRGRGEVSRLNNGNTWEAAEVIAIEGNDVTDAVRQHDGHKASVVG
jgi:hypothetical protein